MIKKAKNSIYYLETHFILFSLFPHLQQHQLFVLFKCGFLVYKHKGQNFNLSIIINLCFSSGCFFLSQELDFIAEARQSQIKSRLQVRLFIIQNSLHSNRSTNYPLELQSIKVKDIICDSTFDCNNHKSTLSLISFLGDICSKNYPRTITHLLRYQSICF